MSKFLQRLDKELKEKSKKPDMSILAAIPLIASMIIVILITNSSFVFFYKNYFMFSLASLSILLILRFVLRKRYNISSFLGIDFFFILASIHLAPLIYHYAIAQKENICFSAIIKGKYFSHTSGDIGWVNISDINSNNIVSINNIGRISGVSKYEFIQLPSIGSKIQICGDISKVGFSYTYIDTAEPTNPN